MDLDTSAGDLRGVRVAVVGPALHPEHLLAPDPPHLYRVHALLGRIVGHREEDGVALTGRVVELVEVALPPVVVMHGDVREALGDLMDEVLVHRCRCCHQDPPR
jgi:hypothetical protein